MRYQLEAQILKCFDNETYPIQTPVVILPQKFAILKSVFFGGGGFISGKIDHFLFFSSV
jgi:hypothetical protein